MGAYGAAFVEELVHCCDARQRLTQLGKYAADSGHHTQLGIDYVKIAHGLKR
ncbi:hypothetical protein MAHJHV30_02790 [Mycobacterium avium subsp. hominissuis]|nr:hypothetical protein I552_0632 [Mycobacterium xenopi 3993]